jgi:hypothetical protein
MRVYRLSIEPGEYDSEGEDHDEWYPSLLAAAERRAELIKENPSLEGHRTGRDFEIAAFDLADLPPRRLALALLNRHRSIGEACFRPPSHVKVPHYERPKPDSIDSTPGKD